ncbi:MAG: DNA-processing protein DprA [Gemmatimonadota bacterium]
MDTLTRRDGDDRTREVEARLVLDALPGVGPATQRRLLERHGSARAALRMGLRALPRPVGIEAAKAARDPSSWLRARRSLDWARRLGMETVVPGDAAYPQRLHRLTHPPGVLFLRGRMELLGTPGVAIVGSRKATTRARAVARRLGSALARAGTPVVSGLALGVDGAAHRGALEGPGPTVAVLGRGADRSYPRAHSTLFKRILDEGLVVSEFPPGTPPAPHHFPRRNRIIAALCSCLVVVEAGPRSGALITVEHALDLGLDVWAVPGPFDEAPCLGSNRLLRDGARALVSLDEFLAEVVGPQEHDVRGPPSNPEQARILTLLEDGPRSADDLARTAGVNVQRVLAVLAELELRGWVERSPGMRFGKAG